MNGTKQIVAIAATAFASCLLMGNGALSDEETKRRIADFVILPSRLCGHALGDFRDEFRRRKLTNRVWFDGDTNRLARLIVELAQTNDMKVASMMIDALGEYGTNAQLPFLYSCATNPVVGEEAVNAVIRIEGVNSNSLAAVQSYLLSTNGFPLMNRDYRTSMCRNVVKKVFSGDGLSDYRPFVLDIAHRFAEDVNMKPKSLDMLLVSVDPGFRYTKRRLAILRSAKARLDERIRSWNTNDVHFASEEYIYNAQTNYLFVAIGELIACPEANFPD